MTPRENIRRELALHDSLARVMADDRFTDGRPRGPEIRTFIVAHLWAMFESGTGDVRWKRTKELAGYTVARYVGSENYRIKQVFAADAPRYEPPSGYRATCQVPMLRGPRVGESCGKSPVVSFRVTDPNTGEWHIQGWCTRHRAEAEPVRRLQQSYISRAGTLNPAPIRSINDAFPEPLPNVGRLLPGYVNAKNWPALYSWALYGWKPPKIGIDANDWPVLARVEEARSALHAIDGDGDWDGNSASAPPALRLVR